MLVTNPAITELKAYMRDGQTHFRLTSTCASGITIGHLADMRERQSEIFHPDLLKGGRIKIYKHSWLDKWAYVKSSA